MISKSKQPLHRPNCTLQFELSLFEHSAKGDMMVFILPLYSTLPIPILNDKYQAFSFLQCKICRIAEFSDAETETEADWMLLLLFSFSNGLRAKRITCAFTFFLRLKHMGKGNHIINCQTRWQRVCVIFHVPHNPIVCYCISEVYIFTNWFLFRLTTVNRLYTRRKILLVNIFVVCLCVHLYASRSSVAVSWTLNTWHSAEKIMLFGNRFGCSPLFFNCSATAHQKMFQVYMSSSPLRVAK